MSESCPSSGCPRQSPSVHPNRPQSWRRLETLWVLNSESQVEREGSRGSYRSNDRPHSGPILVQCRPMRATAGTQAPCRDAEYPPLLRRREARYLRWWSSSVLRKLLEAVAAVGFSCPGNGGMAGTRSRESKMDNVWISKDISGTWRPNCSSQDPRIPRRGTWRPRIAPRVTSPPRRCFATSTRTTRVMCSRSWLG
jgi:hypothetical protein